MAKNFESRLLEASSEETVKSAKTLLKNDALCCAWRTGGGAVRAVFRERQASASVEVEPGEACRAECSCRQAAPGKLCDHAVAAIMYAGRFSPSNIKPIDDGAATYAGLKYESLDALAARDKAPSARIFIEAASAFPHVPSKWENAVLNVKLRCAGREYLGNVNNLRQLFFDKTLSIAMKLTDFSLQDQQIIRFLAINGEPDNSCVLLNSEQTAEFFHCLVGFDRFFREGRSLIIHGESAEPVILKLKSGAVTRLSPGIRVGGSLLPVKSAKVISGRAGCWIGRQGEYFFIPATLDVGWLRNFFRTGEQEVGGRISENFLDGDRFPLPVLDAGTLELERPAMRILLGGELQKNVFTLRLDYLYGAAVLPSASGRLARIGNTFIGRDECAELAFERELEMFGFIRRDDGFIHENFESVGIFLDRLLPEWQAARGDIVFDGSLLKLCGGGGVAPVEFRCHVAETRKDSYLLNYRFSGGGSEFSFREIAAAVRAHTNYLVTLSGAPVRIPEELRKFIPGAENILREVNDRKGTFELPFFSAGYFLHLTENLPGARPPELFSPVPGVTVEPGLPDYAFCGELRHYQREGVNWMRQMTDAGFNVILADEMGLGKTIQLLALLAERKTRKMPPALVICPASLVLNWEREAHKFIPDFRVAALSGGDRDSVWENPAAFDLIVTSYATARRDAEDIKRHRFSYLILDEAQHIKNPGTVNAQSCKAVKADHRIVLTGTPLENSSEDLWSIFDFLNPGMLGSFNAFRQYYGAIRESIELQQDLSARVSPFLKRRTKAEVGQELPPKQERTLFCDMSDVQRELYETVRAQGRKQLAKAAKGDSRANTEIFTTLLRLRQICCHPGLLPDEAHHNTPSAKFELLQELVLEHIDSGHKLLLFSQFTTLLGKITGWLDRDDIRYEYLDGGTRNRQQRVDNFNNDPQIPLFLLSLKAGGTGLNLTSADTVVICDPWWNPAAELQAADRTHRIGQKRPVSSLKLLVRDSIEEKILELQTQKQEIFDNVIDNPNAIGDKLSIEELRFLLS